MATSASTSSQQEALRHILNHLYRNGVPRNTRGPSPSPSYAIPNVAGRRPGALGREDDIAALRQNTRVLYEKVGILVVDNERLAAKVAGLQRDCREHHSESRDQPGSQGKGAGRKGWVETLQAAWSAVCKRWASIWKGA